MRALLFRLRTELRAGWRAPVVLGIVAGLTGAAVLTALAGARRTDSAYDRMLRATDAADVVVRLGTAEVELDAADVRALPQVANVGEVGRYYLTSPGPRATLTTRAAVFASASVDGRAFFELGRPKVLEGRLPNPDRPREILVSRILRDQGSFDVGEDAPLVLVVPDESVPAGVRTEKVRFRIVGVGVTPDQIGVDEQRQGGLQMLFTPAFARAQPQSAVETSFQVRLRAGANPDAFARAVRALAPGAAIAVASTAADRDRVDRATRPQVVALWVFAAVLALASLLIIGQALGRQLYLEAADDATLGALGIGRRQRMVLGLLRAAPVAVLAACIALVGAAAASPLMPVGPARVAEPDPGFDVDVVVLAGGGVLVALVLIALAVLPAWRLARRPLVDEAGVAGERTARPRLAERLARLGAPPTAVTGTRFALEPGRGPTAVPTRSALVGVAGAGTALVAAIVVAANLTHLIDTPEQWGATWDVTVSVAADARALRGEFDTATVLAAQQALTERQLRASHAVSTWSVGAANVVEIAGKAVPALGIGRRGGVAPRIVDGRAPRDRDEAALGRETLDELGVEVGDRVRTDGHLLRIVGVSVLPRFQTLGGADEAALNRGAVLTLEGVLARSPDFFSRSYLVRLRPGIAPADGARRLRREVSDVVAYNVEPVAAPEDIEALDRVVGTPVVLAAVLGVLALATLAHALVTSVRRRRRDLAILVVLGFTRRQIRAQVRATVAWQASVVTFVALLVGVPVGIVAGRLLSVAFEDRIGAISDVVVPVVELAILVPVALLAANVLAVVPGRLAARTQPSIALRSE